MKKRTLIAVIAVVLIGGAVLSMVNSGDKAATANAETYESAVKLGYRGTLEEWIAALVGETVTGETQSAYLLACEKGYSGTFDQWMQALTRMTATDQSLSAYQLMCQNGFGGTLTEWLNTLACNALVSVVFKVSASRMPKEAVKLACGSASISRTRLPSCASLVPR